ncbi:MAG TPA: isomerizing glutamine--fructose-6-phosphate transaminase, partial [Sphingomicrobium sp.]|nr:isomerizing glutamine--fructose-6-phosphate transaminase [Sphingomicrobium sp.]
MCGIVGIVGTSDVAQRLFDGLKRLEYRGYDSAGICTIDQGQLVRRRAEGKLDNLARELAADPLHGSTGIAHTRWATHGAPTVGNAHPHIVGPVALVHNGIIENFKPLRDELIAEGRTFESETDTEVVGHLVAREVERGASPQDAVAAVLPRLTGAFAIAFLFRDHPELIIGARMGAPLTVGYGEGENYLGSDALAVAPWTQRIAYLDEGDWAVVRRDGIEIFDRNNQPATREIVESGASSAPVEKGNYAHYMQKEIFEQPIVVAQTLQSYVRPFEGEVALPVADADLSSVNRLTIVACGTSFYAGLVAKYWIETF